MRRGLHRAARHRPPHLWPHLTLLLLWCALLPLAAVGDRGATVGTGGSIHMFLVQMHDRRADVRMEPGEGRIARPGDGRRAAPVRRAVGTLAAV